MQAAAHNVADAVLPIVELKEGSGKRIHIGTATLIDLRGRLFLVTAAHVVSAPASRYVLGSSKGIAVPDKYFQIVAAPSTEADLDVAFWPVREEDAHAAGMPVAIGWNDIQADVRRQPEGLYVAVGHPVSRSNLKNAHASLHTECMVVTMNEIPSSEVAELGYDADAQVVMRYDKTAVTRADGQAVTGAKPTGMSGGPIFYPVHSNTRVGAIELLFAGIITEHDPARRNAFVTTRSQLVVAALDRWGRG